MSVTLDHIAKIIGADIPGHTRSIAIHGIASLEHARGDEVSFLSNPKYVHFLGTTHAAAVIVGRGVSVHEPLIPLVVADPYIGFLQVLELFNTRVPSNIAAGIHPHATIHQNAVIGHDVSIGAYAVIGNGVQIGDKTVIGSCSVILQNTIIGQECLIYPNVTIMDGCEIGNRVILHAGVVIGSDGFGFAPDKGRYRKIPQIGRVRIGDDVEIGACSCVDRAAFGETVIERGTKIDNLVQVAHNVVIGPDTVIAAQTGIGGSTNIGGRVRIGGQAGITGHITVADSVAIGAQAGVSKDIPAGQTVSGYPAKPHYQAMRMEAAVRSLPNLIKRVRELEHLIHDVEKKIKEL